MPLPALALLGPIAKVIGSVIDRVVPDKGEAAKLKAEAATAIHEQDMAELNAAVSVIVAEAQGGSWIQRSWRPITMLTFVALIVAKWMGFTAPGISGEVELALLDIVKIGLGGYVVGRSAEKVAKIWREKP
jgi:Na+-transporting methylmalonyl-CoA/oxaloacetate decarboxylase gamma subunit